jgi:hypothetical protein
MPTPSPAAASPPPAPGPSSPHPAPPCTAGGPTTRGSTAWDIGHAAHRLVLGAGPDFAVIEHDEWRTKTAKAEVAEARAAGLTPIKPAEHEQVQAMAAAIRAHPLASVLLSPEFGLHEATIVWRDPVTGVWHRAMLDTLHTW